MKTKAKKRVEAELRQAEHDELTTMQKLTKAHSRPGDSARERARLQAKLVEG